MKVLWFATVLVGLIMFSRYSGRLMPQKPVLDFSWKYHLIQRGCMLVVVCVWWSSESCVLPSCAGEVFLFWQNFVFFPDVSIKYHTQILLVVLTARPPNQTEKGFIALPTSSIFKFCSRGSLPKFPRIHNFCYFWSLLPQKIDCTQLKLFYTA